MAKVDPVAVCLDCLGDEELAASFGTHCYGYLPSRGGKDEHKLWLSIASSSLLSCTSIRQEEQAVSRKTTCISRHAALVSSLRSGIWRAICEDSTMPLQLRSLRVSMRQ